MAKRCIYCKNGISDDCALDVCESCGIGVWGEKMFHTIKTNMEDARDRGDLLHQNPSFLEPKKK